MYFFGHIGMISLISFMLFLPMVYVLIGSILPDIIDKPLFLLGLAPSGRYISHTLLFVAISFAATYLITRKMLAAAALSFGTFLHLLGDATHFVPWFYPFVNYTFVPYEIGALDPAMILAEVIGFALLIIVVKYGHELDGIRDKIKPKFHK